MSKPAQCDPQDLLACAMCFNQVPACAATVPEAVDYCVHFCGLDCYAKWQEQAQKTANRQ